ncbi:4-(cytidine 5'-diphospho)-2-C-methyl-D-erythritol kinase [Azospirillum brasilense]|uniref:4-diphosphocytidyl-2-C-methyl-D-erythritol kinase n=1 Tax=Azospirillum brasilense TaxID=192 RepID=A0A0P0ENU9_AZOBR|nr:MULTISPECIES: 4-(cytidine 5'-diphospho)-2-C-methyl-D-erythritol kinase [Azospirillum]ALJ37728.1 4-diphosphocytidyl-2C-methyl-D-erythritol kinase [Azospirillum brasilense]MDW7556479.1 4-(cytidine 5'-diphospho)-2-C-methyl-D-erythritol kinase [Azospirillum brasilense]MDW7592611.1 4-(cytidine 5'-diphospho)-2-C-methyl-D-erythritol kinase [Azospirillum brasilense]MDW7628141.1 4-(cytidine 5'-diphospho)-2-C-methyl-D-erythritol kinase [Azospirillum brasilense]MDX5952079.1 4-(cytidine 5'-diphospho)-2
MSSIAEAAPAKLNLYLHVVGRRDDGYHELDSLVAFADVADRVTVQPGVARIALRGVDLPPVGPRLAISGPFGPALMGENPANNLVIRAAHALAARLGREADAMIVLEKVLPIASGIGGGSADAAATLRALARLWGVPVTDPRFYEIAASLGADVPVCVAGRSCYFGGVGEVLEEAPALPDTFAVLVNPGVPVPTPAVFKACKGIFKSTFSAPARFTEAPADAAALAVLLKERRNDLTEPALTVAPVIADVLVALDSTDGCLLARLSGSGATCFGLYADAEQADAAARSIQTAQPRWWAKAARLLPTPADAPPLPKGLAAPSAVTTAPVPPVPFPDTGGWGVG